MAEAVPAVVDVTAEHRFTLTVEGHEAELVYRLDGDRLVLVHTGVPDELGGRGIGGHLVAAAVHRAEAEGLTVVPECAYARSWLEKHPDDAARITIEGPVACSATTTWGEIQGQPITFPMEVEEFDAATLLFSVPSAAARALIPGDAFEVVEVAPGVAQLVVAFCDYIRNPWGEYLELNFGFLARPAGAADDVIGSFVYRMPVDQAFTCEAGNRVMGFPKTVEQMRATHTDGRCTIVLHEDGAPSVTISVPTPSSDDEVPQIESISYSYLDGVAYETPLAMDMGTGMIDPADVEIVLGSGPIARDLAGLGLPKAPDMATWGAGLSATFQLGRPVT